MTENLKRARDKQSLWSAVFGCQGDGSYRGLTDLQPDDPSESVQFQIALALKDGIAT
jgi:hypothetical protein